jgi:hypothetical protein
MPVWRVVMKLPGMSRNNVAALVLFIESWSGFRLISDHNMTENAVVLQEVFLHVRAHCFAL